MKTTFYSIKFATVQEMAKNGKLEFIGSNQHQVNNQGVYTCNENSIYKQVNNRYHKIANIL